MYAITHNNLAIGPCGPIKDIDGVPLKAKHADDYNKSLEAQEIEHFKTQPERIFAYIGQTPMKSQLNANGIETYINAGKLHYAIKTWMGTHLGYAWVGPRRFMGFQSRRRPVTVSIFGALYHGWWFESTGDYVRLKKAKNQSAQYAATLA